MNLRTEVEPRLFEHPIFSEPVGERVWCLHCCKQRPTEEWVANDWSCPTPGCDGDAWDVWDKPPPGAEVSNAPEV